MYERHSWQSLDSVDPELRMGLSEPDDQLLNRQFICLSSRCVFRRKRTLIPSESEQRFQLKANTDSDSFRTVIPTRIEHGVRWGFPISRLSLSCR